MGTTTSAQQGPGQELQGDHYSQLLYPATASSHKQGRRSAGQGGEDAAASGAGAGTGGCVLLAPRASVLKNLSWESLWQNFLDGSASSFALTPAEATALLLASAAAPDSDAGTTGQGKLGTTALEKDVKNYITLVGELSEKDIGSSIDFMAVCSSVLLLGEDTIESKADQLYSWIVLRHVEEFNYEEFVVAMASFDRGVSHALGKPACSEAFIRSVATQWMALADPKHKGSTDALTRISASNFFDFCTNRQHVVRRMLEALSTSQIVSDNNLEVQEVTETVDLLEEPSGGDEWMANPAWKKTAQLMLPSGVTFPDVKPSSTLELEWVHGYRGFDCRNNVRYADKEGKQIIFSAAALGIAQDNSGSSATQSYFAEHGDDIISLATVTTSSNTTLVATGEIGKAPAVYLYEWMPGAQSGGQFVSLSCLRGYHTKGVAQLCFSIAGDVVFSVGVDYTVAIYGTESGKASFGKMVASSQGPKGKVLHCIAYGASGNMFLSCGEKHAVCWTIDKGVLKQETCKLGTHKNKMLMAAARGASGVAIIATSDGELLVLKDNTVMPNITDGQHSKKSINALWSNSEGTVLVSGGRDGKINLWRVTSSGPSVSINLLTCFSLTKFSSSVPLLGVEVADPAPTSNKTGKESNRRGNKKSDSKQKSASIPISSSESDSSVPPVRSVCLSVDGKKVLVGTQSCEILEYTLPNSQQFTVAENPVVEAKSLVIGHYKDELWGLAVRPVTAANQSSGVEYCTVGDDRFLRLWDLHSHSQKLCLDLNGMARACAYSPDGYYLAVGFGGTVGRGGKNKEDGIVRIFRFDTTSKGTSIMLVKEIKEAKAWISVVKYSPDGNYLAVGARDNNIYVYSVTQQYKRKAKFSKHNAGINQLDFSADGKYIQSCCCAYEILFSEAATGAQETRGGSKLKDTEWASWTCTLGWPVIGIWSGSMDGSDINATDRSPSGKLLATADDFSSVNVFKYPAVHDGGSQHVKYSGHSSHVTCVRWLSEKCIVSNSKGMKLTDDYLISVGGDDKCVFQWKVVGSEDGASKIASSAREVEERLSEVVSIEEEFGAPTGGDEFMAVKPWLGAIVAPTAWTTPDPTKKDPFFAALGELSNRHQRLENIKANMSAKEIEGIYTDVRQVSERVLSKMGESGVDVTAAPDTDELQLEWVHGYRGFDCRNNVFYASAKGSSGSNERQRYVLYHAAALGILLDPVNRTQRYFRGHTDDILAMAVCSTYNDGSSTIVATGQQAKASTFVWEVPSLKTLAVLQTNQKSVACICFSNDGRLVVTIAQDKTVAVCDWQSQTLLCNTKGVASVTHHLVCSSVRATATNFISCGDKHIRYWTLNGRNLTAAKVLTSSCKGAVIQEYLCITECEGKFLVGCEDGMLYTVSTDGKGVKGKFSHHLLKKEEELKKLGKRGASVTAITYCKQKVLLVTGAKDGSVVVWHPEALASGDTLAAKDIFCSFNIQNVGVPDIMAKQLQGLSIYDSEIPGIASNSILVLASTRGCDLLEIKCTKLGSAELYNQNSLCPDGKSVYGVPAFSALSCGILNRSHCNNELWGVSCHPTRPEYCSVGDDKTLRFYHLHTKCMLASVSLGSIARTCAYSPDGMLVAIGFGGSVGRGKEAGGGIVRIYSAYQSDLGEAVGANSVRKLAERADAKQWISDVKFSSDSSTLVVGAHDCKIYIYDVTVKEKSYTLKPRTIFTKHNSVINHIDLSADGRFMQSNCSAYELLFADTTNGKHITHASELKDVAWHSWTCTLGWPVQGIWASGMNGSDINAVDRSHSGHLIATSDDLGKVNLFRYPCVHPEKAQCVSYAGHSSHVMNVRWTVADEYLISCGGNDKCLMQWRHTMADAGQSTSSDSTTLESANDEASEGIESESTSDSAVESSDDWLGSLLDIEPGGGDESGAVKPWLGAIRAPKNPPPISADAPAIQLDLEWVHGYTTGAVAGVRIASNLKYNLDHNFVYTAAALGVLLDRSHYTPVNENQNSSRAKDINKQLLEQSFFQGHDNDVLCLTISRDRRYIATGQAASITMKGRGSIIVWDSIQCRILCRMDGCHQRAVTSLAFNTEGNQLLSVGKDDNNTHTLWCDAGGGWSRFQQLATSRGDRSPVLFSAWVNTANPMVASEYHFITGGSSGINFWRLEGSSLSKKKGRFSNKYKQAPILCCANIQGKDRWRIVMGTSSGDLYLYDEREVNNAVESAHNGPILCLAEGGLDCLFLVSGGSDKQVRVWNQSLQPISLLDISSYSYVDASISAIDVRPSSGAGILQLLVGTGGGDIMEVSSKPSDGDNEQAKGKKVEDQPQNLPADLDLSKAKIEVFVNSHVKGELWGLATHPIDADLIATAGDDGTLRIWSMKRKAMLKCLDLQWPARSLAWHPLGAVIAVGFHESVKGGHKGGRKGKQKKGKKKGDPAESSSHKGAIHLYTFKILNSSGIVEMEKIADGCKSIAWIHEIKFSPSGAILAAGSHDKRMYAYSVPEITTADLAAQDTTEWNRCLTKTRFEFNKHSSAVLHFDFSLDGKYFQSNCQASELLFGTLPDGRHETSASKLADYNNQLDDSEEGKLWASQTCKLGWPVQGIWPPGADSTDINAVDRHVGGKLLATADDFGQIKVFRFPCVTEGSKYLAGDGHSSHVTNVRWTVGNHLISTGGNDKCVFIWHMSEK